MANHEVITFQFGNYSNYVGAHWWNLQESSFVYTSETAPEINFDVLFREGENYKKEVTYTPRLLLTDLKGSLGGLQLLSDLYEEVTIPNLNEDVALWPADKIQVEQAPKYEKNEFLKDLQNQEIQMKDEAISIETLINPYKLEDKVHYWSDYLATKFHPRTVNVINEYQNDDTNNAFNTYSQGTELWKTDLFAEEWTDKCRAYAEECDYLQGFQVLFDCVDGFSGLSCSALAYLRDEFSSKSILSFPSIASSYPDGNDTQDVLRTVNSVLSFAELIDLSSAFVPLCTGSDGWNVPGLPRKFNNLHYDDKLWYHSSALLAAFLDTVSIGYRVRKSITRLSSLLSNLSPCGRNLLTATMGLPFPVYPGLSILESLESLKNPYWTTLSPKADVTMDTVALQEISIRGLSAFSLLPSADKRVPNPASQCKTVDELLLMYLDYCSSSISKVNTKINSIEMSLKIPSSFPNIFNDNVTRIGCISPTSMPFQLAVTETPVYAGLHNSSSASNLLTQLHDVAAKINLRHHPNFANTGFESLEYSESLEKLLTLNDNYN